MKILHFDLETTGVNPGKNGIHQISGIIEFDGVVKEEFNFKVRPNPAAVIEPEALEVAGVTLEQILAYPEMSVVYQQLIAILDKYVDRYAKQDKFMLCGFNSRGFDDQFLRGFWKQNYNNYFGAWFWPNSLDTLVLASEVLQKERPTMENFKLKTVAATMGITVDEAKLHDALYDVQLSREIYWRCKKALQTPQPEELAYRMLKRYGNIPRAIALLHLNINLAEGQMAEHMIGADAQIIELHETIKKLKDMIGLDYIDMDAAAREILANALEEINKLSRKPA